MNMLSKLLKNKYLHLAIRILIALVFIIASIEKIADPFDFANDIKNYDILSNFLINITAIILPWVELFVGLMILLGIKIKANSILVIIMLLIFNIAVFSAWMRGLNIDCGCYGDVAHQTVGWQKLLENFLLIGLSFILYFFPNKSFSFENKEA